MQVTHLGVSLRKFFDIISNDTIFLCSCLELLVLTLRLGLQQKYFFVNYGSRTWLYPSTESRGTGFDVKYRHIVIHLSAPGRLS